MRLTLRTLLSWKDGMLDADAARDIAARVESSEAARRLAERIDAVASDGSLSAAAPDAAGFAADANTTAEYLDNTLEPGQLAEFERACFQSDALLAETAAAHEMLASWWRDPAPALPAAASRRLLEAARGRCETRAQAAAPAASRPTVAAPAPSTARPRRAPPAAWLLVASAILLLVSLVAVLGWSLTRGSKRPADRRAVAARGGVAAPPAGAMPAAAPPRVGPPEDAAIGDIPPGGAIEEPFTPANRAADASVAPPSSVAAETTVPAEPGMPAPAVPPADPVPAPATPAADVATPSPPAQVDAAAPLGAPVGAPGAVAPGDRRVPQGDALAIAAPAVPVPPPASPPAVPVAPPAAAAAAGQAKIEGRSVLLHRPSADPQAKWLVGAAGTALQPPVELAAPPFCRPTLDVGGIAIAFDPGTRAALGRDADGTPRLEVVFGAAAAAGGGRIGITAGALAGVVATTPGVPVGVEVRLDRRPGDSAEATRRVARVQPAAARVEWRQTAADGGVRESPLAGIGAVAAVAYPQALVWRSDRADEATIEAAGPPPAGRRGGDALDRLAGDSLARRLAAGTDAIEAIGTLAVDPAGRRRVESRLAAAATLAMLGEFDAVAELICAAGLDGLRENEWERLDAVAVQPALARGPKAAEGLARALAAKVPPAAADAIARLARGLTDDELADGGAAELVAGLESPHLAVRRYAIKNLVEITGASRGDQLHYRADWTDESLRDKGVAWWRAQLDRGGIRRGTAAGR